jgi:hypothetical protein
LDPAVRRRAADILNFIRPNDAQRVAVLEPPLHQLGFSRAQIAAVVAATGPRNGCPYGFTFSDLTQRLLPAIVLDSYPDRPVSPARAVALAQAAEPTAPFQDGAL